MAPTVDQAVKAAEKRRRRNTHAEYPLPITKDHIRQPNTVYPVASPAAPIAGHRTNTVSEFQTARFLTGELPTFNAVPPPSYPKQLGLLQHARRTRSVDARVEAIVDWGGDKDTSLAIQPIDDILPEPKTLEDVYPGVYRKQDQQARRSALRPVDTLEQQGEAVNPEEPATEASNAMMGELFGFEEFDQDQEARLEEDGEEAGDGSA